MNRESAETLYYKEEERKAELLNILSIIIAILGLLLGLYAYFFTKFLSERV